MALSSATRTATGSLAGTLPSGASLPSENWERRHRAIVILLGLHAVGLAAFGLAMGVDAAHSLIEGTLIAGFAMVAMASTLGRRVQSIVAAVGLMTCSAVLTHLSGGYVESHFHFFVMLGVIFLYEDWLPYVLAVGYVVLHHGVAGSLDPASVYNHPDAIAHPWRWASIHALFITGLSAALIVAWNVIERARRSETQALGHAQELKRALLAQEKMASLGSLVSGLAHEVRTPLTVVGTSAGVLELAAKRDPKNPLSPRVLAQANEIQSSVERMNALVLQLRRFHAPAADELREEPLDAVVREAMRLFSTAAGGTRAIHSDLQHAPGVRLHPLGVQQVVINLVTNAVEATDPVKGVVTVRTRLEGSHGVLSVEDNGVGMSEEAQLKAFDPLFTTKKDGMGLGLHIVKRIVDQHGATIRVHSAPGKGTTIEVRFPLARAAPARDVATAEASAVAAHGARSA